MPTNLIAEAASPAGATVTFEVSANDAVAGSVPVAATPASGSIFPLGVSTVAVSASDSAGNTATGNFTVTVVDTTNPVLTVPEDIVVEATGPDGAKVEFAASASDAVGATISYSHPPGSIFPVGTTTVTVTARDAAGNTAMGSFAVIVRDTTAPSLGSLVVSKSVLWPPNHEMVPLTVTATASDAVGISSLKIIQVTSSEPDSSTNEHDHPNDVAIAGDMALSLRAERLGNGSGRVYSITVQARDAAGNASTQTVSVAVPKSQ
jgi:hypothetical protein